eukprot:Em0022g479a
MAVLFEAVNVCTLLLAASSHYGVSGALLCKPDPSLPGCICKGENFILDISRILPYPYSISDSTRTQLNYSFSPCKPIQCANSPKGSAVCQYFLGTYEYNCGLTANWTVYSTNPQNFSVVYSLGTSNRALLNPKLEAGAGLGHERRLTRPANILIPSWSTSDKPAAIDVSSLLRLNQAFCLKREWLQVQQLDRQRENTQVMIPSAPNEELTCKTLFRVAGSYCRMARATPPNLASDALEQFDKAAQLGLKHGGLGLRSLSLHAPAAFIASLISSGHGCLDNTCLQQAVTLYNAKVSPPDALTVESVLASPPTQKALSSKIDMNLFHGLLENASPANKARLLSESASHAAAWLSVVLSIELGLHLEPNEYQVAVWWWLGLDTSGTAMCPFCPGVGLDALVHHCVTCQAVVWRQNLLHEAIASLCHTAHLSIAVEKGGGGHDHTRPADVLIAGWDRGKHAALDVIVASPLCPAILPEASHHSGAAANGAELRKLNANSTKCTELGWTCIPMAVEAFGHWGRKDQSVLSRLASHLSISLSQPRAAVVAYIYGRLNIILVRSVSRAILSRLPQSG